MKLSVALCCLVTVTNLLNGFADSLTGNYTSEFETFWGPQYKEGSKGGKWGKGGKGGKAGKGAGAVFTLSNKMDGLGNSVIVFDRASDGTLTALAEYYTGGLGGVAAAAPDGTGMQTVDPLASSGALILSTYKNCLLAVNPGSDTITSFQVDDKYLHKVGTYPSNGNYPTSLTQHGDCVYVLNGASTGTISGYSFDEDYCSLSPIPDSTVDLGYDNFNPPFFLTNAGQIALDPLDGKTLVLIDKPNNKISTFEVGKDGLLSDRKDNPSEGLVPFSGAFDWDGNLVVNEIIFAGADPPVPDDNGAVSTYALNPFRVISSSVRTFQTATCWGAYANGGYFFTSNTAARTISSFEIEDGKATLKASIAAETSLPTDLAATESGDYLYVITSGDQSMFSYSITDGELAHMQTIAGISGSGYPVGLAVL